MWWRELLSEQRRRVGTLGYISQPPLGGQRMARINSTHRPQRLHSVAPAGKPPICQQQQRAEKNSRYCRSESKANRPMQPGAEVRASPPAPSVGWTISIHTSLPANTESREEVRNPQMQGAQTPPSQNEPFFLIDCFILSSEPPPSSSATCHIEASRRLMHGNNISSCRARTDRFGPRTRPTHLHGDTCNSTESKDIRPLRLFSARTRSTRFDPRAESRETPGRTPPRPRRCCRGRRRRWRVL